MSVVAFDAKEFRRIKFEEGKQSVVFHCPLGVGIEIEDPETFRENYLELVQFLAHDFKVEKRAVYSSEFLREKLSLRRAIPFCEKIISRLQDFIKTLHVTFVALPRDIQIPVGGYRASLRKVKPSQFARMLSSYFSYVTAWDYFGKIEQI